MCLYKSLQSDSMSYVPWLCLLQLMQSDSISYVLNCFFIILQYLIPYHMFLTVSLQLMQFYLFNVIIMSLIVSLQLIQFDFMSYVLNCVCTINAV